MSNRISPVWQFSLTIWMMIVLLLVAVIIILVWIKFQKQISEKLEEFLSQNIPVTVQRDKYY